jgi:putative transposase
MVGQLRRVDWGVSETATTTDPDFDLPHAQHGKRAASRLAHYQRQMARRSICSEGKRAERAMIHH